MSTEAETEVERLRNAIREHRDQRGDDRCWLDDLRLYEVLPEKTETAQDLPPKREFLESCERYWKQRQSHIGCYAGGGKTIAQLEAEIVELKAKMECTYCAYCGAEFPVDGAFETGAIGNHIATCVKHPMRAIEMQRDVLAEDAFALFVRRYPHLADSETRAAFVEHITFRCEALLASKKATITEGPSDGTPSAG